MKTDYIKKYLERINYNGNTVPTLGLLSRLQELHLLNIPFENLDIHYSTVIKLNIDLLYNKIVTNRRGGFCYELNGLFYTLLLSLGFKVKRISAKVYSEENGYGQEFDHLTLIVTIDDQKYLTDVGFGEFTFVPLKLKIGLHQNDPRGIFIINKFNNDYYIVNKVDNKMHKPQYIFTLKERKLEDFNEMCMYHQTSTNSHFTKNKLITLPTHNGRITLDSYKLKIRNKDTIIESQINNEQQFDEKLLKYFNIKM